VRWKALREISNKRRRADPPDVYSSCAGAPQTAEGFRLIWIRSSAKAQQDETIRLQRLDQARADLALLAGRLNRRRLRNARLIRRQVQEVLARAQMEGFLDVHLRRGFREELRRLKRGRPAAGDPVRVVRKTVWSLRVGVNTQALRAERRVDGVFPLVTNLIRQSKKEVLEIYKYQPYVEKRFSQLKTDLEVAPVYLKKPLRCAGLVHAYYVVLAVSSLIERCVRPTRSRVRPTPRLITEATVDSASPSPGWTSGTGLIRRSIAR